MAALAKNDNQHFEMDAKLYLEKMKDFQKQFLEYLDNEDNSQNYKDLIQFLTDQINRKCKEEIQETFRLIANIADNHYRTNGFFDKIDRLLSNYKEDIKQTFSNFEIFDTFKSNKRILLFLINESLLQIDKPIFDVINDNDYWDEFYVKYFFNECKRFLTEKLSQEIETDLQKYSEEDESFDEKRKKGENDNFICELIRKDSLDDFILYVNETNFALSNRVRPSIFETNKFLFRKNPTLIEYSLFFGSIKIFKYLMNNKSGDLMTISWQYAIHGNNAEIIQYLEDNNINPYDKTFRECLEESVKCYDKNLSNYFIEKNGIENVNEIFFKYHNYEFFTNDIEQLYFFFYLCKYNYIFFVKKFLNITTIDINEKIDNKTPFRVAVENDNTEIIHLLLNYPKIEISADTFKEYKKLTELKIPETITFLGERSFMGCSSLVQIKIPSSVKSIKEGAFSQCSSLKEIEIPSSITSIEDYTFYNCTSLTKVTIPSSVTSIGLASFQYCSSLVEILIPPNVNLIGKSAFAGCLSLTQIEIPNNLTEISDEMFHGCSALVQVNIPSSVTRIGESAFCDCSSLVKITIPSSVKSIEKYAFKGCNSLKIDVPSFVAKIGEEALPHNSQCNIS